MSKIEGCLAFSLGIPGARTLGNSGARFPRLRRAIRRIQESVEGLLALALSRLEVLCLFPGLRNGGNHCR
jgi:hypothetical protein